MVTQSLSKDDEAALGQIIRRTFGTGCRIEGYSMLARETDYTVLAARLAHPELELLVKLAGPRAPVPCPFDRTAAIYRLVRTHTTVPVSGVLAVDVSYREFPWRYMITTYLRGHTWAQVRPRLNATELRDAYWQLGQAVATLHTIELAGFGEIDPNGTVPFGSPYLQALAVRAQRRIAQARHAGRFLELLRERAHLFADVTTARLTHEDLHADNILFRYEGGRWQLSGIVDFDSAWAGDPESDLARLELWRGMMGEGFPEAYAAVRPVAPGYLARRALYQLLWCLEYGRSTAQHIADTRHVCAALGLAPDTFM